MGGRGHLPLAPQLRSNLRRSLPSLIFPVRRKADCANPSMTSAAIALADPCQIDFRWLWSPRIRSHRHFHAKAAFAQAYAIDRLRMEIVGDELVISLEIVVRDVEEDRGVFTLAAFL